MPVKYGPDIGYSLWLVPPKCHVQHQLLSILITEKIPQLFNFPSTSGENSPQVFSPHITLTSAIPKGIVGDDPKAWLEGLTLPNAEDVRIRWTGLDKGDRFLKKLFIRAEKDGLDDIARLSRLQGMSGSKDENGSKGEKARKWVEREYDPHASLLYWDIEISDEMMQNAAKVCNETSASLLGMESYKDQSHEGWDGGVVWLVPTFLRIEGWKPVAERVL